MYHSSLKARFGHHIKSSVALILAAIFFIMLWFNFLTPMFADDYSYCFSLVDGERVNSLNDIFSSMHLHRKQVNGRYFSHVFAMLFLMLPKEVFNVVNAAVSALSCYVIYRIITLFCESKKRSVFLFAVALMMLWNFTPAFGEVYLWLDGSCNYSWAICSVLIFIFPFLQYYCKADSKMHPLVAVLLTVQAFIAGAYSESGSLSAIFIAFCLLALITLRDKKLPLALLCNFVSACGGLLFLVLSPSMLSEKRGSLSVDALLGIFSSLGEKFLSVFKALGTELVIAAFSALVGALILLFCLRKHRKILFSLLWLGLCAVSAGLLVYVMREVPTAHTAEGTLKSYISDTQTTVVLVCFIFLSLYLTALYYRVDLKTLVISAVFFMGGLCSIAIFIFALYIPARGCCYYMIYLCIACAWLLSALVGECSTKIPCMGFVITAILMLFLFCFTFRYGVNDIIKIHEQAQERLVAVQQAKEAGVIEIEFEAYEPETKYSVAGANPGSDVNPDPNNWPNPDIAAYFGLEKVSIK